MSNFLYCASRTPRAMFSKSMKSARRWSTLARAGGPELTLIGEGTGGAIGVAGRGRRLLGRYGERGLVPARSAPAAARGFSLRVRGLGRGERNGVVHHGFSFFLSGA